MPSRSSDVPVGLKAANHATKREHATEELRRAILDGRVAPGQRIRVLEWAASLNVSPTPLREALAKLGTEGLVRMVPHHGAVVAGPSDEDVQEAWPLHRAVEGLAA